MSGFARCPKCAAAGVVMQADESGTPDRHCLICGWRPTRPATGDFDMNAVVFNDDGTPKQRRRAPMRGKLRL